MREELVPQEFGEDIGDAGKYGKEVVSENEYGAFGYVAAMEIKRENLESAVPIFNNGATILDTGLVVEDLETNGVTFGLEARHDSVLGRNAMAIVA